MITAVVCAAFDAATDAAILATRDVVRAAGVRLAEPPAHRPHITLAAARIERAELPRVLDLAGAVAARHQPFRVALAEVGRFAGSGVIWLGPSVGSALPRLQADADAALRADGWPRAFGEHSDPTQWIAHCTLATRVREPLLRRVQSAVRASYEPIEARIEGLATILVGGRGDVGYVALG